MEEAEEEVESEDDFFDAVSHVSHATKRDSIGTFHSVLDDQIELEDEVFDTSGLPLAGVAGFGIIGLYF